MPRVTRIEITVAATANLGDYSNTKPSITLDAEVLPGELPVSVLDGLIQFAEETLHAQIDRELMAVGRAPRYYDGPAFDAFYSWDLHLVVLMPAGSWARNKEEGYNVRWNRVLRGWPFDEARTRARDKLMELNDGADSYTLLIAANDDELPALEQGVDEATVAYEERQATLRAKQEEQSRRQKEEWDQRQAEARERQAALAAQHAAQMADGVEVDNDEDEDDDDDGE